MVEDDGFKATIKYLHSNHGILSSETRWLQSMMVHR